MERRALLLTGTVGVGKTTIAIAVAEVLAERGEIAGCIDMDAFSRLWPAPQDDPFRTELALANLGAVAPNFWVAGASALTLAWVIESQRQVNAVADRVEVPLAVVRLTSSQEVIHERLRRRHAVIKTEHLEWHLDRSAELEAVFANSDVESVSVENAGSPRETAARVLDVLGWRTERVR